MIAIIPIAMFVTIVVPGRPWLAVGVMAMFAFGMLVTNVLTPRAWWVEDRYGRTDPRGERVISVLLFSLIVGSVCVCYQLSKNQRALNASETLRTVKEEALR